MQSFHSLLPHPPRTRADRGPDQRPPRQCERRQSSPNATRQNHHEHRPGRRNRPKHRIWPYQPQEPAWPWPVRPRTGPQHWGCRRTPTPSPELAPPSLDPATRATEPAPPAPSPPRTAASATPRRPQAPLRTSDERSSGHGRRQPRPQPATHAPATPQNRRHPHSPPPPSRIRTRHPRIRTSHGRI